MLLRQAAHAAGLAAAGLLGPAVRADLPQGTQDSEVLDALPGKQPLLKRSWRPPNYETPLAGFADVITPNERFFTRWHHAGIPEIGAASWRLEVGGDAAGPALQLTLGQLRDEFEPVDLVAVCQCAGNRRGWSDPHVPGVQWGPGAMGNARWRGARLKDILARAGVAGEAVEVAFNGADRGPLDATPQFVKSIPAWKALDEHTLVAYQMNGAPLPHWNGFPARIVVPGWTATYWMKQVTSIRALRTPLGSFWMSTAYRIPRGTFPSVDRFVSQETDASTPITDILVNSLITHPLQGSRLPPGRQALVRGLAWDGGAGIGSVVVSMDGGRTWRSARLGPDLGRYSFRAWQFAFTPTRRGTLPLLARATSLGGASQPLAPIFSASGYHNNAVQQLLLEVA
jgi:DMSO/TMAO reductase YedYZ molybdopterin-dependent catalytic subunit